RRGGGGGGAGDLPQHPRRGGVPALVQPQRDPRDRDRCAHGVPAAAAPPAAPLPEPRHRRLPGAGAGDYPRRRRHARRAPARPARADPRRAPLAGRRRLRPAARGAGARRLRLGPRSSRLLGDPRRPTRAIGHWRAVGAYAFRFPAPVLGAYAYALGALDYSATQAGSVAFVGLALAQVFHVVNLLEARRRGARAAPAPLLRNPW